MGEEKERSRQPEEGRSSEEVNLEKEEKGFPLPFDYRLVPLQDFCRDYLLLAEKMIFSDVVYEGYRHRSGLWD